MIHDCLHCFASDVILHPYLVTWEDEVKKIKEAMLCCVCKIYMRFSSMFVPFGGWSLNRCLETPCACWTELASCLTVPTASAKSEFAVSVIFHHLKKTKLQFQLSALLGCQAASGDPTKACNLASTIGCGVTCRFRVRMTPDGWGSPTVGKLGKIWVWAANGHSILALRKRECGHRVPHFGSHGTTISVPLCCWRMTARTRPRCPRSWDLGTLNSPRKCGITGSTSWYIERSSATLPGIPKGSPPTGGHIIVWTATARCRERKVTAKPLERWAWHRLMEERDWRSWHGL